jgi:hypothetical protein
LPWLTWIDARNDPAQTSMPCGMVGKTLDKYPLGVGSWSPENVFFGPPQQLTQAGCFDENFSASWGDRLGRYNESPYVVVNSKFPNAVIQHHMGVGFSNGQNIQSQVPTPPALVVQSYHE